MENQKEIYFLEKAKALAEFLRKELKGRKIKGYQFAKMLGKKPPEISKWLKGPHNFTLETLFEIEECFGICLINITQGAPIIPDVEKKQPIRIEYAGCTIIRYPDRPSFMTVIPKRTLFQKRSCC